jgi:hypothetical protein
MADQRDPPRKLSRQERRAHARQWRKQRYGADYWIARLAEQAATDPERAAFSSTHYGLTPEEAAVRNEQMIRAAIGDRLVTRDEVLAAVAALEGKTVDQLYRERDALETQFVARRQSEADDAS